MHKIEVQFSRILAKFAVSLFTGERIEIACARMDCISRRAVSLLQKNELTETNIIF